MKHFFKAIPLILFVVLFNISSCQRHDEITESEIESKSPGLFIKTIPREHLKEMSPSVYNYIQKINSAQLNSHAKEDTSSIGFHINDTEVQVIENENFTTYTCFAYRDHQTPNILENYTLKEYNDGTFEQYVLGYHYVINSDGTMLFDTSVLDIEVVNDEGILLNKESGCLPEFVQVIDDYVCTENTRCTGNGQHEAGSSNCLCTPSPSTCDPAGSVSCDYTYVWVYNDCSSSGTTDNSTNDTTNSNTPSGGNSNSNSNDSLDDELVESVIVKPAWVEVVECMNNNSFGSLNSNITLLLENTDILWLQANSRKTGVLNNYLKSNSCDIGSVNFADFAMESLKHNGEVDYERSIIKDSTLTPYPCQKNLLSFVNESNSEVSKKIKESFVGNDSINLIYKTELETDPNETYLAKTEIIYISENAYNIQVTFESLFLQSGTDLAIILNMIHENIHATLLYGLEEGLYELEAGQSVDYEGMVDAYAKFKAFRLYGNELEFSDEDLEFYQHEIIQSMIDDIANEVKSYAESKGYSDVTLDFCKKISWIGLQDTIAFTVLSDEEQQEIINLLQLEIYGFTGAKGLPCN